MANTNLGELFESFSSSAFRLESLPAYDVDSEKQMLDDYVSGVELPAEPDRDWCKMLRADRKKGKSYERVRVVPKGGSQYFRFEVDWGYVYNAAAGEVILMLMPDAPADVIAAAAQDFWLFDDEYVALMNYNESGQFLGAEVLDRSRTAEFIELQDLVRAHAMPLREFLAASRQQG